jgi:hypothetical protein
LSAKTGVNEERLRAVAEILRASKPPGEQESVTHSLAWPHGLETLANAYFLIVAICHQTSPVGERRLEGFVGGTAKVGWDYLKERFLEEAARNVDLTTPAFWRTLSPLYLSTLFKDEKQGLTLNRINERAFIINDLGEILVHEKIAFIVEAFQRAGGRLSGPAGILQYLTRFIAYGDPVRKKAMFFVSIAHTECSWKPADPENLLSPVDYHEMRGHLRMGTVTVLEDALSLRVQNGLALNDADDAELRNSVQSANAKLSEQTGLSSSVIHYLLWNLFRNCCPRDPSATHCDKCSPTCALPAQYKSMPTYRGQCILSSACESARISQKVIDPPYIGHYY